MKSVHKWIICCLAAVYMLSDIGLSFSIHHCNCHFKEQFSKECRCSLERECSSEHHDHTNDGNDKNCNFNSYKPDCHTPNQFETNTHFRCCSYNFRYIKLDIPQNLMEGKGSIPIIAVIVYKFNFDFVRIPESLLVTQVKPEFIFSLYRRIFTFLSPLPAEPPIC